VEDEDVSCVTSIEEESSYVFQDRDSYRYHGTYLERYITLVYNLFATRDAWYMVLVHLILPYASTLTASRQLQEVYLQNSQYSRLYVQLPIGISSVCEEPTLPERESREHRRLGQGYTTCDKYL
jgi:hypothetical protein